MAERFERHRQPWTSEELEKLKLLGGKGMALKAVSKAMTRSEESIKDRAKLDGIGIAKLRQTIGPDIPSGPLIQPLVFASALPRKPQSTCPADALALPKLGPF